MNPFQTQFPNILEKEPLSKHCTYNIGGPADFFYNLENIEELPDLIETAKKNSIKYLIIGHGTNILFPDKGFNGLVIKITAQNIEKKDAKVSVEAGLKLSQLIKYLKDNNLTGMESLAGVPGTVGGGVYGNCGAFGTTISDFIETVTFYNKKNGKIEEKPKDSCKFSYRYSIFKDTKDVVLKVTFQFKEAEKETITEKLDDILAKRKEGFVSGFSCGSFFKNPNNDLKAGYLVDKAGCKGLQVGDAQVSLKNANYILNIGKATQKDILELAEIVKEKVKHKFEVELEEEVQIIR